MIIGYPNIPMTDRHVGSQHDDLRPAYDASVDRSNPRGAAVGFGDVVERHDLREDRVAAVCRVRVRSMSGHRLADLSSLSPRLAA